MKRGILIGVVAVAVARLAAPSFTVPLPSRPTPEN
jgi:hypothetical protein